MALFTVMASILIGRALSYGTCDDTFHIQKHTVSTSNSYRDSYYAYNIFPYLDPQDTEHFIAGMCANGMKVQLPDSCFKLHAPETWQRDPGLLNIDILEKKFVKKWQHVMSTNKDTKNYDSFLDFNIAFWVQSLDDYIEKWQQFAVSKNTNGDDFGPIQFEYFGIEWYYEFNTDLQIQSKEYKNHKFYSILVHSPLSSINYEFLSFQKPSDKYYKSLKWIPSDIPRVTFLKHNDPYPWNRPDQTPIVPVRISRATTNIDEMIQFYVSMMEAQILFNSNGFITDSLGGDNVQTKVVSLVAGDTKIELQFLERPSGYTAGDFSLKLYEQLLLETHDEVISTPFCGIDRWFDNHYGMDAWSNYGYFDRIIARLNSRNTQKYRIYQTPYEHSSPAGKTNLDKYGKDTTYIFFVFEPSGQCIQMMGDFPTYDFGGLKVPNWNAQWCYKKCPYGMVDGVVDTSHIYVDTEKYYDETDPRSFNEKVLVHKIHMKDKYKPMILLIGCIGCIVCLWRIISVCKTEKSRKQNDTYCENTDETPLIVRQ